MIYVRAQLAPDAIRWAIRLSQTTAGFCNECVRCCLENMERGLKQGRDVSPMQWQLVDTWKLREGTPLKTNLSAASIRRALERQQDAYRLALLKLEKFERAFHAGVADLKIVFQLREGPKLKEQSERWPDKLRRTASHLGIKPNELGNRMIAAGIVALEREDPDYEPEFVIEYRQKFVLPKIEQARNEQKLAEHFNAYSDVPQELQNDDWAFIRLIEVTNLTYSDMVDGFLGCKTVEEVFRKVSRDPTLGRAYLDKLKAIFTDPAYQDWSEPHPLRNKRLKKEIVDAWVEDWRHVNRFERFRAP